MKISKLLNKRSLSILLVFSLIYFSGSYAEDEPVDIWDLEKETNLDSQSLIIEEGTESDQTKSIFEKNISKKTINGIDSISLDTDEVNIVGLYDPEDNGLTMNMWSYSNGDEIKSILKKLNKINLSKDAKEILDIALLTNSYFPEENITELLKGVNLAPSSYGLQPYKVLVVHSNEIKKKLREVSYHQAQIVDGSHIFISLSASSILSACNKNIFSWLRLKSLFLIKLFITSILKVSLNFL